MCYVLILVTQFHQINEHNLLHKKFFFVIDENPRKQMSLIVSARLNMTLYIIRQSQIESFFYSSLSSYLCIKLKVIKKERKKVAFKKWTLTQCKSTVFLFMNYELSNTVHTCPVFLSDWNIEYWIWEYWWMMIIKKAILFSECRSSYALFYTQYPKAKSLWSG